MKSLITTLLCLLFAQATYAQQMTTEELVTGVEKMVRENNQVLSPADLRQIRRNFQEIRLIFSDYGIQPQGQTSVSRIFSCTSATNPQLIREIYDMGTVIRTDVIQVFTEGFSNDKKAACEAELTQSELGEGVKGVCRCGQETNPVLTLEIVGADSFQTLNTKAINAFSTGFSSDKKKACQDMADSLAICTGI